MKKTLILATAALFIVSPKVYSDTKTLLNQEGNEIDLSAKIIRQKQLTLDDPFVIQLYSSWKALGSVEIASSEWIELILNKDYEKALASSQAIKDSKLKNIKQGSMLYLLYKTGMTQTFFNEWIDLASSSNFLQTEFGIALDQVLGEKTTELIMKNGYFITPEFALKLKKIENAPSKINYSLQALNALRTRENAVNWIGKLDENDPLRMPLAQTALLHYATEGKLGASGKIIKDVIEPILTKSSSEEELSLYFMTLGRLLYQAGALSEAKKYFDLIPESSSYFLKARTEALWVHLKARDFSRTKGELATLELSLFNDKFHPEAYLVSAMANVMLCQFVESKKAISRFIEVNKKWASLIEKNINDPKAEAINENFVLLNLTRAKASLADEKLRLEKIMNEEKFNVPLENNLKLVDNQMHSEISKQWSNRKTMLESALYKMQFVKIELISRMRAVEMKLKIAGRDEVSLQRAAPLRNNQMSFPNDGHVWGDELFNMSATVINKCMNGELKGEKK